jgi:hypothetical protein
MNINLHIERLVLDDVAVGPGGSQQLQQTVQAELVRLLTAGGLSSELAGGAALPTVPGKTIQTGGDNAGQLGRQIAGSIYSGIGK